MIENEGGCGPLKLLGKRKKRRVFSPITKPVPVPRKKKKRIAKKSDPFRLHQTLKLVHFFPWHGIRMCRTGIGAVFDFSCLRDGAGDVSPNVSSEMDARYNVSKICAEGNTLSYLYMFRAL